MERMVQMRYIVMSIGGDLDLVGKLKGYDVDEQTAAMALKNPRIDMTL